MDVAAPTTISEPDQPAILQSAPSVSIIAANIANANQISSDHLSLAAIKSMINLI